MSGIMTTNPMITVDGVVMPCPSAFTYGLQDVSASESGRVEDENATMYKNRITQKTKLSLGWAGKDWAICSKILQAFNPEYIHVTYPDLLTGKYETKEFYSGDKTAPYKWWWDGKNIVELLSFDIVER